MAVQESLEEYLDKHQGVKEDGFTVDTDEKAEWVLRKLSSVKARRDDVKRQYEEYVNQAKTWLESQSKAIDNEEEYFNSLIVAYLNKKRAEDPNFKTLKLPHGKIGFRKQQPKWTVDKSVGEWLWENGRPDLVRIKKEPEIAKLKKAGFIIKNGRLITPDTGEIVPGVEVVAREDKPIVEAN